MAGRHESGTLCAISCAESKLPKKRSKGVGTPRRATNTKTGGRPSQVTAGKKAQDWAGKPLHFNPDGVFESCDARLRHVGGQFTVLDGHVTEVRSNVLHGEMLESCGTPCGPRQHAGRGQFLEIEVVVRRCYVSFLHFAFLSAVLCPGPSSLFLTTGDCLTVCLLFSVLLPLRNDVLSHVSKKNLEILQELPSRGRVEFVVGRH